jgi:uncharacterized protein RhaS with RHS repeats
MQGRIYDPTVGRFLTADPIVQSPFWSQGLNRYAYVFNSPMNLVDPGGFSAIGDYFQGLNDAPPEQAIPGYIGTGLVAGLAVMAVYEGVSASFAAGTASTVSTAATQSGGLGSAAPAARGAGAATVAIQRIKAATEDSVTRETGEVPTRSTTRPIGSGKASAPGQTQAGGLLVERLSGPERRALQGLPDERTAAVPICQKELARGDPCNFSALDLPGPGAVLSRAKAAAIVLKRAAAWVTEKVGRWWVQRAAAKVAPKRPSELSRRPRREPWANKA